MIMGVDIETYSSVDLAKAGTRPYTEAPDFTILLIGYKVDDQPTRIIDLTGEVEETITFLLRELRARAASARPRSARLLDSVPPEVNTTSDGLNPPPSARTMSRRASSRALAAARPRECSELGFAPA